MGTGGMHVKIVCSSDAVVTEHCDEEKDGKDFTSRRTHIISVVDHCFNKIA